MSALFPELATTASRLTVGAGVVAIVSGGLVAAVARPMNIDKGSWLAAYLVLICGVGTYAIGALTMSTIARPWPVVLGVVWVAGNVAVILGSLSVRPLVVDVGTVLLVVGIVIALVASFRSDVGSFTIRVYQAMLIIFAVSAPIGSFLAHVRALT